MKLVIQTVVFFLLISSCNAASNNFITKSSVGLWELGIKFSEAEVIDPRYIYILNEGFDEEEGHNYRIGSAKSNKEDTVATFILSDTHKVIRIHVFSPLFQTKEGISVGTPIYSAIKAYPNYVLSYPGEPVLTPAKECMEFSLPPSAAKNMDYNKWNNGINYDGDNVKISSVRIGYDICPKLTIDH